MALLAGLQWELIWPALTVFLLSITKHSLRLTVYQALQFKLMMILTRLLLLSAVMAAPVVAEPVSLFDGKTLEGWDYDPKVWRVEDGAITGGSRTEKVKTNYFISTKKSFHNFELKLKIKCSGDPATGLINSGIQVRSHRTANGRGVAGYQIDCGDKWFGKIYDEHRTRGVIAQAVDQAALDQVIDPFGWNEYRIRAEGPKMKVWINDVLAIDYTESNPNIALDGIIAPQVHGGGVALVQVKDVTIEELPATPGAPTWESLGGLGEALALIKPVRKRKGRAPVAKEGVSDGRIPAPPKGSGRVTFDFESGDLQGWYPADGWFMHPVAKNERTRNSGLPMNKEGTFYLGTLESGEGQASDRQTGVLESPVFQLTGPTIQLAVSGGRHPNTFVGLYTLDGKEVRRASGNDSEMFVPKTWNVAELVGKPVYLRMVDQNQGAWGHVVLDAFSAEGKLLPQETKKRKAAAKPKKPAPGATPHNGASAGAKSPAEQLATFTVPEGFVVELVASEENGVINPIDLTFDDAGRLWTQTAEMYPLDPITGINFGKVLKLMNDLETQQNHPAFKRVRDLYQLKTKGTDKILIHEDPTKPAVGKLHVWADGLSIPQSILPYKDGAYVAHGSELFLLRDTNGDGKSDKMQPVLSGFGFTDTHTMSHLLVRSPGSYVHFSQGALNKGLVTAVASGKQAHVNAACQVRFTLDHQDFEVVSSGRANMWGLQLRANGQWYSTEANDGGYSVMPYEHGTSMSGPAAEKIRSYQPYLTELHDFRVGGTGISGLAFSEDLSGGFPEEWKDVALLANPITNTINSVRIVRNPNGTVTAEHLGDLLVSTDKWFRPVNLEFGPDGCLYIADFYNKIVSHNEVSTAHPDRDKSHGRIWRIRHVSQPKREIPDLTKASPEQLLSHLKSPYLWEKRAAWHQIGDRKLTQLAPALIAMAADQGAELGTRIHALWTLEELRHFDAGLLKMLVKSEDGDLRREAIRSLPSFALSPSQVTSLIAPALDDENVMVRSQVLRTLRDLDAFDSSVIKLLIRACKPVLEGNGVGGPYERNFERYLARMALERFPAELEAYLKTSASEHRPTHLLWAIQALSDPAARNAIFLQIWDQVSQETMDTETFVAVAGALSNKDIREAVAPTFRDPSNAEDFVATALASQSRIQSPQLVGLLIPAVKHLLQSKETLPLALNAISTFKMSPLNREVAAMDSAGLDPATLRLLVAAKGLAPGMNAESLAAIGSDENLPMGVRMEAALSIAQANPVDGRKLLLSLLEGQDAGGRVDLVSFFSQSRQGAQLLVGLYGEEVLILDDFDRSAGELVLQAIPRDPVAKGIMAGIKLRLKKQAAEAATRIKHLTEYVSSNPGDAEAGKAIFSSCLACHAVGSEGQNIAPPLDGSGLRELDHLLTAIVSPDAAVESAYALYRVTKTDGSTIEGYLDKEEPLGKTLAVMGGARIFVPTAEIRRAGFVAGRSFMPASFGQLPDATMADLVAYIATLK